jgi:HK97 family phage portal protein
VKPPPRDSAGEVTASTAVGLDAVFRAVQIVSTGVSQLTLDAYRGGAALDGKAAASWLAKPNVDESLSAFLTQSATSLALSGNAFWRVYRSAKSGEIVNLRVLPAGEVMVTVNRDREVTGYHYRGEALAPRQIRHLQYLRRPGEPRGLGPIQAAQQRLRGAVDLDAFAGEWFGTAGVPTGVLSTDQFLTPEQAEQWRDQWHEAQRERGTAVLGAGLGYETINISPKDAQFIESQQFSTTALARLFGIPANLMLAVVEGNSMTYQNVAQADLSFLRWTLSTYTREIEEAFTSLLPRGQLARFNLDAILRPDTAERYTAHKTALEAGFLTVNEVRAIEGYQPLAGGDVLTPAAQNGDQSNG